MKKSGFTLIELLVVIAIIGILSVVVLTSLSSARKQAIVASKKSDLQEVLKALQMYEIKHGDVPDNLNPGYWDGFGAEGDPTLQELVDEGYFSQLPESPDNHTYYYYKHTTYAIVTTKMSPEEYGPWSDAWHCSDDRGGSSDKRYCIGFPL